MKLFKKASGKTTVKMSRSEWTEMGKKAGWLKRASDYDSWKTTPDYDDDDGPSCPTCDGPMEEDGSVGHGHYNWKCLSKDCDGYINNERDYG